MDKLNDILERVLRELTDELHFKRPHYPGLQAGAARLAAGSRRPSRSSPFDPITDLLLEVLNICYEGAEIETLDSVADVWQRSETTINARFRLICELLGPEWLSRVLEDLVPAWSCIPPLEAGSIWNIFAGRRDGDFGQPDLLFLGDGTVLTIEMKVRGGRARAVYDADQHFRYLRLAQEFAKPLRLRTRAFHVLLAPVDGVGIVQNRDRWISGPLVHAQPLRVDPVGFRDSLSRRRQGEAARMEVEGTWTHFLRGVDAVFLDLGTVVSALGSADPAEPSWRDLLCDQAEKCIRWGAPG